MSTRILTRADVESVLEIEGAVHAVEGAVEAHGRGHARMPAKVYLDLPEHDGDFRAMPSVMDESCGVQLSPVMRVRNMQANRKAGYRLREKA